MNAFLIIVTIIMAVVLFIVSIYLLVLYCHPDDKGWGTSLYCKILVIVGMTLTWAQVLMLPLDAANSRGLGEGLDMDTFWKIIYMTILIFGTLFIPFAQYFYESDEDNSFQQRCCYALYHQLCYIIIVCLLLFISYAFLRYADIPVYVSTKDVSIYFENSSTSIVVAANTGQVNTEKTLEYEVSFPVYVMAFLSLFGYIMFVVFGGVGLTALPMDLIKEFTNRPKMLTSSEAMQKKQSLRRKSVELMEEGNKLKEDQKDIKVQSGWWTKFKENRRVKGQFTKFKMAVLTLDRDYEIFKLELLYHSTNPIVWYVKLVFGCIFCVISFIWWLHILLFIVIRDKDGIAASSFLNKILISCENGNAGFVAVAIFAFLSLYLLWCTQKGNFKFGVRIPFIFSLHIMKVNETWMNTFLFNIQLMLICSVAVTQFCAKAFQQYIRLSTLNMLFSTQIQYLRFFTYLYANNVFEIALLVWAVLTMIYLLIKRSDKPQILKDIEDLEREKLK